MSTVITHRSVALLVTLTLTQHAFMCAQSLKQYLPFMLSIMLIQLLLPHTVPFHYMLPVV